MERGANSESIYEKVRREFVAAKQSEIEVGLRVIADCESLGVTPPNLLGKSTFAPNNGQSAINRVPWHVAIDLVLRESPRPLTVKQIVTLLQERGRIFPVATRPTVSVSSVFSTKADEMGWRATGEHPRRWRAKSLAEPEPEERAP
ncbi:MAG: hypothetical protein ACKVWV_16155 [Planctomycetota bacterium]